MSKQQSSRIPMLQKSPHTPNKPAPTSSDLGRFVSISEKTGILRYIGNVHFSSGIWCGIELLDTDGKNNGIVHGVKYFTCDPNKGLMVPFAKVEVEEGPTPEIDYKRRLLEKNPKYAEEDCTKRRKTTKNGGSVENLRLRQVQEKEEESNSKRNSLEVDESLGILTPDQMPDWTLISCMNSCKSSSECVAEQKGKAQATTSEALSLDNLTDYSLGLIDKDLLKSDAMLNIGFILQTDDYARLDHTPSPEELPLDPVPVMEISETTKSEQTKSKTNSIITSITSITSLDTGYQGDGEMSRPASRGADKSPLTRRPVPRTQIRNREPLTDSDFFTESDADNHEEVLNSRRVQIIDGTLYGVDAQAAADIYVNNKENMDSSGIFTDLEINKQSETSDNSPATETSTKTLSNSQETPLLCDNGGKMSPAKKENLKKRNAPSSTASTPSSVRSPRHVKEDTANKTFKMPRRDVPSKVKAMLETKQNVAKKSVSKKAGRWDAVMNKISKNEPPKTSKEQVACKLFDKLNTPPSEQTTFRSRSRPSIINNVKKNNNSIHSSLSDLSGISSKTLRVSKKKDVVQVLTTNGIAPKSTTEIRNGTCKPPTTWDPNNANNNNNSTRRKRNLKLNDLKKSSPKESPRATVKGGRNSPVVRPPQQSKTPKTNTATPHQLVEGLGVVIQHLMFDVVPTHKKDIEHYRKEAVEQKLVAKGLQKALDEERELNQRNAEEHERIVEELKANQSLDILREENEAIRVQIDEKSLLLHKSRQEYETLQEEHSLVTLHNLELEENVRSLGEDNERLLRYVQELEETLEIERRQRSENEEIVENFKCDLRECQQQLEKFQRVHEESLQILHEELDEKSTLISQLSQECDKLRKEQKLANKHKCDLEETIRSLSLDNNRQPYEPKDQTLDVQEVESLRVVLELKQNENAELRRSLAEAMQKNDHLTGVDEKAAVLTAKCEDLQLQLERKTEYETRLSAENKKLQDTLKEENNQKQRLSQYNEELQWKLRQRQAILSKVLTQISPIAALNSTTPNFERTYSFRETKSNSLTEPENHSLPNSPRVKGVVEKSDWVSYVLDMDENPDLVASRLLRNSFRKASTPKTPEATNKRPRMKSHNLRLSSSASAILTSPDFHHKTPYLDDPNHPDLEEKELDVRLPPLSSEMCRNNASQTLPVPKHLAGEAMVSFEEEQTSPSSEHMQELDF